jgi:hypothetical protein
MARQRRRHRFRLSGCNPQSAIRNLKSAIPLTSVFIAESCMARLTLCLLTIFWTFPLLAQSGGLTEEAKLECERRGNLCEVVRGGVASADSPAIATAMQPPKDDSDKWFITLVTSAGCPQCERLKRDFRESEALRPYVNTQDHQASWAHYNVIRIEDETQAWRWKTFKPTSFPTVLIQPPLNGVFGDATTYLKPIVGYGGSPKAMAATIRARIADYVEAYDAKHQGGSRLPGNEAVAQARRDPPFRVLPPESEDAQSTRPFFGELNMTSDPILNLILLLIGNVPGGLTGAIALAVGAFLLIREYRKRQGMQLLVTDEQAAKIEKLVESVLAKRTAVKDQSSPPSAG